MQQWENLMQKARCISIPGDPNMTDSFHQGRKKAKCCYVE